MRLKLKRKKMNNIHFWTLTSRYFSQIFADIGYLIMLVLQVPAMLLIIYLIYEKDSFLVPEKVGTQSTTIFVFMLIAALMGLLNSYREITKEHQVLSREMNGGLNPVSYVSSKFFVLGIITLIQSIMFVAGSFLFIDFNFTSPIFNITMYFISIFLTQLTALSIGLYISSLLKSSEKAILPVLFITICQIVFSGTIMEFDGAMKIFQFLSPAYFGVAILGGSLKINEIVLGNNKSFHRDVFDTNIYIAIGALILFCFILYNLTIVAIKRRNKRD